MRLRMRTASQHDTCTDTNPNIEYCWWSLGDSDNGCQANIAGGGADAPFFIFRNLKPVWDRCMQQWAMASVELIRHAVQTPLIFESV